MQTMIYISEREYEEMKEQIIKLWGIIHLMRQDLQDRNEASAFRELVLEKYKKTAIEMTAKVARMKGEMGNDTIS